MLVILRRVSFRNKPHHLENLCEWHPTTQADEKQLLLCHHWEVMKSLSALFLNSWFKLHSCQDQEKTHFYSFLGTLLKGIRRSFQKKCSKMALKWSGEFGVPNTSLSHLEGSDFLLWKTEIFLHWTSLYMWEVLYYPREVGLVQSPVDTI